VARWHRALFGWALDHPQDLVEHARGYASLASEEVVVWLALWRRHALLTALALVSAAVGVVLVGVGLLLWAALPTAVTPERVWVFWAVPAVPLGLSAWLAWHLRVQPPAELLRCVKTQLALDWAALQTHQTHQAAP
jgi:hypothetical protein